MDNVHTYENSFYNKGDKHSQAEISTNVTPAEYKGYLIYERVKGSVWDIVHDGVCVGMNAGPNGARKAIDEKLSLKAGDIVMHILSHERLLIDKVECGVAVCQKIDEPKQTYTSGVYPFKTVTKHPTAICNVANLELQESAKEEIKPGTQLSLI